MTKQEEKQQYREHARAHRGQMPINESDFESVIDVFLDNLPAILKNCHPDEGRDLKDSGLRRNDIKGIIISLYWPVGREFDCRFLLDELVHQGFNCALPCSDKQTRLLTFKLWTHDTKMLKGAFSLMEPEDGEIITPDIVIAPLLAFDQKGYRLGQGGGFYDTTIAALRQQKDVVFMGIGFAEQAVLFKLPREDHDIPLDYMLTPQGLIDFKDVRV